MKVCVGDRSFLFKYYDFVAKRSKACFKVVFFAAWLFVSYIKEQFKSVLPSHFFSDGVE